MNRDTTAEPITHVFDTETHTFADQLVLWSVRKWVMGHKGSPSALALLENAYARTSTDSAVAHLDLLMRAITAGAARRIAVHAPCCAAVSTDELLLIDAIALAQAERKVDVAFLLRRFLTPEGARAASAPLRALAAALQHGGLRLTVRSGNGPLGHAAPLESVVASAALN
ncbi:hypothetical protein [Emcibacter sp. SYSU 3D8]|uniref:hypothetical protein n=1 Tax=Emcibacter sp. SYSU 3D8 TaxID=3133969 RepID=UPI0031FE520A